MGENILKSHIWSDHYIWYTQRTLTAKTKRQKIICQWGKQNQILVRYHFIPTRTAKYQRTNNNKCWQECGDIGTLIHC